MGKRITVDSATMVNKGFEVIEAHYLFDLPYEKIDTVLHRQSIVHSMLNTMTTQLLHNLDLPICVYQFNMRYVIQIVRY